MMRISSYCLKMRTNLWSYFFGKEKINLNDRFVQKIKTSYKKTVKKLLKT